MRKYYFTLHIAASEYLRYYQGDARRVVVRAHDGRSLSIPAANLRRFVTTAGIHGDFCLTAGEDHRLISIERASGQAARQSKS